MQMTFKMQEVGLGEESFTAGKEADTSHDGKASGGVHAQCWGWWAGVACV